MAERKIVAYDGICPLCGSRDGTVVLCEDGRSRVICRVMGCPGWYRPLPVKGYETLEQAKNLEEQLEYLYGMTVGEYLRGSHIEQTE